MKRGSLTILVLFVGCSPNFQSGKTQCSDKGECPSGYICSDNGGSAVATCITTPSACAKGASYFCSTTGTCWSGKVQCSTVANCGTATAPNYQVCPTAGYHPACNGTSNCLPNSGSGGSGGGGSGGSGGSSASTVCAATPVTTVCQAAISGTNACSDCALTNCCGPLLDCYNDSNCNTNSTGPLWNTLLSCSLGCCSTACSATGGQGGSTGGTGGSTGSARDAGSTGGRDGAADAPSADAALADAGPTDSRVSDTRLPDVGVYDARVADVRPPDTSPCPAPAAGGTCNVLPACGCPAGQVCYADIESVGLSCYADSGLGEGADCRNAGICSAGSGCFGSLCSRYCNYDSDCPAVDSARSCLQTTWSSGNAIAGVSVCARVCDPVSPRNPRSPLLACPAGFGCYSDSNYPGASDCELQTGTGVANSTCSADKDCMPGYYCSAGNSCIKYCFTNSDCPTGTTCNSFSTANYAGTTVVGYCY